MSPRLGFLHVPKCGGTSVSNAIFAAYGTESIHIASLRDASEPWGPHDVLRHHVSYRLARAAPFLSGHVSYADMKELHRDVIFTVLRDPHATALSHFTYNVGRARDPKILARHPHLEKYKTSTLAEHLQDAKPGRFLSSLGGDVFSQREIIEIASDGLAALDGDAALKRKIDKTLKRFDLVMAGKLSDHLTRLRTYVDIADITVGHQNKSRDSLSFALGAPRADIVARLDWLCWLDEYVYARCARLFPETMSPLQADADSAVDRFIDRFQPADG